MLNRMKQKLLEYKLDLGVIKLEKKMSKTEDPKNRIDQVSQMLMQGCLTEIMVRLKMDLPRLNN